MSREIWLTNAIEKLRTGLFKQHGLTVPNLKVSCGFPGGGDSKKRIGEHWVPEASDDKIGSVFISPIIDDGIDVLGTLVHELVHASVGNKAGHGPVFRKAALAVGLTGKMRSTVAGPELKTKLKALIDELGRYPHAKLNLLKGPTKKQTTRMIKMQCRDCGYIARASRTSIEETGPVLCACNHEPMEIK